MKVAVLGVGLIGGSIGLAARGAGAEVSGYDAEPAAAKQALRVGAVGELCAGPAEAVAGADVVFVAAPVASLPKAVGEALEAAGEDCVVSDVGSTKLAVALSAAGDPRFIGGHPLAGAETAGAEHARADMFAGATWYLTPTGETSSPLYELLRELLLSFGARPVAIEADLHDRLMACVSHLPHVLANVLVAEGAARARELEEQAFANGPSFRDATRVAGANTRIWPDIYVSNREPLGDAIERTIAGLEHVRELLRSGDREGLREWNERAGEDRRLLEGVVERGDTGWRRP